MTCSMTAFARQSADGDWGSAFWEIRTVNHRYLELSLRLPEEQRGLESVVRDIIGTYVKRGKVDCTLRYTAGSGARTDLSLNMELLEQLIKQNDVINGLVASPAPTSALDLLRWPGILVVAPPDLDTISAPLVDLLKETLEILVETRQREGNKLKSLVLSRCNSATAHVNTLRQRLPDIISALRERMMNRAAELNSALDENRLEQEMLLLAQKLDVAEEIDRLETHIEEIERVLEQDEPVGRRLDFLMQEMNREANTIASKSFHRDSSETAVELKVLIEQMREQIQNIE